MPMLHTALFLLLASQANAAAGIPASTQPASVAVSTAAIRGLVLADRQVRGIHLTCWGAGSPKLRRDLIKKISGSVVNAVVIALK